MGQDRSQSRDGERIGFRNHFGAGAGVRIEPGKVGGNVGLGEAGANPRPEQPFHFLLQFVSRRLLPGKKEDFSSREKQLGDRMVEFRSRRSFVRIVSSHGLG